MHNTVKKSCFQKDSFILILCSSNISLILPHRRDLKFRGARRGRQKPKVLNKCQCGLIGIPREVGVGILEKIPWINSGTITHLLYIRMFFFLYRNFIFPILYAQIFQLLTKIRQISGMLLIFKYYIRLVGDNIDYKIHARIQSKEHGNHCQSTVCDTRQCAIRDSVVDPLLDNSKPQRSHDELQLIELLPTPHVQARLKHSWAVIVSHVVVRIIIMYDNLCCHVGL